MSFVFLRSIFLRSIWEQPLGWTYSFSWKWTPISQTDDSIWFHQWTFCFYFQQPTEVECAQKLALSDRESVPRATSDSVEPVRVFWPCAPDGYIPNSVVRQKVKPRRPPARLIVGMRQPMQKLPYAKDKEEQEIEEGRAKIRGNHYVSNCLRKKAATITCGLIIALCLSYQRETKLSKQYLV